MGWFKIVKLRMVVSGATLGLCEEHVLRVQRVLNEVRCNGGTIIFYRYFGHQVGHTLYHRWHVYWWYEQLMVALGIASGVRWDILLS